MKRHMDIERSRPIDVYHYGMWHGLIVGIALFSPSAFLLGVWVGM